MPLIQLERNIGKRIQKDDWTKCFKKRQAPRRGRLKVQSPKFRRGLGAGAPVKQGCSEERGGCARSYFQRPELYTGKYSSSSPLPTPFPQVQQRQGFCSLITILPHSCMSPCSATQQVPCRFLSILSPFPLFLWQPSAPPSLWAASSAVKGFSQEPWQKKKKKAHGLQLSEGDLKLRRDGREGIHEYLRVWCRQTHTAGVKQCGL